jgi:hypothetical protein
MGTTGFRSSVDRWVRTGLTKKRTRERKARDLIPARMNRFNLEIDGKHFLYIKKENRMNPVTPRKPHNPTSSIIFLTAPGTLSPPSARTWKV